MLAAPSTTRNNDDGTSSATTRDGNPITVLGESVGPGQHALIVDGEISAKVPQLPQSSAEV